MCWAAARGARRKGCCGVILARSPPQSQLRVAGSELCVRSLVQVMVVAALCVEVPMGGMVVVVWVLS